jgi:hypothetical protein
MLTWAEFLRHRSRVPKDPPPNGPPQVTSVRDPWYLSSSGFNLTISEKDMADLAFNGLRSYLHEKLDGHAFITLSQLQQRALTQES